MLPHPTPRKSGTVFRRFTIIASLLFIAGTARSQTFADWVSDDGTTVTGTIGGTSITFNRDANGILGAIEYNGASTGFSNGTFFTPSLANSDFIEFVGRKAPDPVPTYTITFGTTVVDPILLIASNASTLTFSATPTFLSGSTNATSQFIVSGNQVIGTDYNPAPTDANGVVKFFGSFTTLSFTAVYSGTAPSGTDGIALQVGVMAIPEPSTYAAIAGAVMLSLVVWRRRRTARFKSAPM